MNEIIPVQLQQRFWNDWNASTREKQLDEISTRQSEVILGWLRSINRTDLEIIEVGCGAGWFCASLANFGKVTATDLSDEVLSRAQKRLPEIRFVAGDFMKLDFGERCFDVVVSIEVLSHVADHTAFVEKLSRLLRKDGILMLATQNRPILQRYNRVPPPSKGQLRRWFDRKELRALLEPNFMVEELFSVTPRSNRGLMRILHSRTLNRPIRWAVGNRVDRLKEAIGLGWTLMVLARNRVV
jgi:2-polyprenyl-3-methyl-5-hydroxy-6-metoxy-1,4-benzoquinol methylase